MFEVTVDFLPGEAWYGIRSNDGSMMPIIEQSVYRADIDPNRDCNQCNPILLSSKGRYIWCDTGFTVDSSKGSLKLHSSKEKPCLYEGFETLKGAFLDASAKFFPANGRLPHPNFFKKPQYNTWIELIYNQNQEDVIAYAKDILKNGFTPGILMIDDGWAQYYGKWDFNRSRFPNPRKMTDSLHKMGFEVMVWVCPFISPDSFEMKALHRQGYLVKDKDGEVSIKKWWNGYSAVLDLSNPDAVFWYKKQLDYLRTEYGIDGFKFDAGDGNFYQDQDVTFQNVAANTQTELYAMLGLDYEFNEYRACFKCAGLPLVQRLADKNHSWGENGVASLMPNQLLQGILGYAYTCPDMIGGGEFMNFLANSKNLDEELFVRYAQCAALMPMMQFSAAPWRLLSKENTELCKEAAKLHIQFAELIYNLAENASRTGEPIVRYLEYEFPNQGFESVTDEFMLGSELLVAPVYEKEVYERTVLLPEGKWQTADGMIYEGGRITVPAPLHVIPYFHRLPTPQCPWK